MKIRGYAIIFIVAAVVLGFYQLQRPLPNQQIVIEFGEVTLLNEKNDAVNQLKNHLQSIGAEHISVSNDNNGLLKINYYTSENVEKIKASLSLFRVNMVALEATKNSDNNTPKDQNFLDFTLNVFEISKGSAANSSIVGTIDTRGNDNYKRTHKNSDLLYFGALTKVKIQSTIPKQLAKIAPASTLVASCVAYGTHQVRAGPTS